MVRRTIATRRRPAASSSAHALLPVPDEFKFQYHVRPTVVKAADVSPGHLADKEVCILVNAPLGGPGSVPADFVQSLSEFVKRGHGLLITSGPNVEKAGPLDTLGSWTNDNDWRPA